MRERYRIHVGSFQVLISPEMYIVESGLSDEGLWHSSCVLELRAPPARMKHDLTRAILKEGRFRSTRMLQKHYSAFLCLLKLYPG